MAQIQINKTTYSGNNIVINNGRVIIDGQDITPESKVIDIQVTGDLNTVDIGSCRTFTVSGNVSNVSSQSGDIEIGGNVQGDVESMSGDINIAGFLNGNAKTMSGDIRHR